MTAPLLRLLLVGLGFLSPAVLAQSFGYIRVQVVDRNPDHRFNVVLSTNGVTAGRPFSHASEGFTWTALNRNNLSSQGASTPISASYGALSNTGCEFDYQIFFSSDGSGSGISLGGFTAPLTQGGAIPLGLNCAGSLEGDICSTDPQIQARLAEEQMQTRVRAYNQWKQDYDARTRQQETQLAAQETELNLVLAEKSDEPWITPEAEKILEEFFTEAQAEFEAQMLADSQEALQEEATLAETGEEIAELAEPALEAEVRAQLFEAIQSRREDLIATGVGAYVVLYADLQILVDGLMEDLKLQQQVRSTERDIEAELELKHEIRNLEFSLRQFRAPVEMMGAAAEGLRFTPAGDAIDLCEAVTGRAFCGGAELSATDRLLAAISIFIGARTLWRGLINKLDPAIARKAEEVGLLAEDFGLNGNQALTATELVEKGLLTRSQIADLMKTSGLDSIVHFREVFPDNARFISAATAMLPHDQFYTEAGVALTSHWHALGFTNARDFQLAFRTTAEKNRQAALLIEAALKIGTARRGHHLSLRADTIDYVLPNGLGAARFREDNGHFITFIRVTR